MVLDTQETNMTMTVKQVIESAVSNIGGVAAASHIHVWDKILRKEKGDTLELGGGMNSTSFISSHLQDNTFITLENSKEWYNRIVSSMWHTGKDHRIEFVSDWDTYDWSWVKSRHWKYIFIDHSPGEHRIVEVNRLLPYCDYMIIHDTDADRGKGGAYGWSKVEKTPKYWVEYMESWQDPSTTICSNYYDPQVLVPRF
jgi:hypothetical protein